MGDLLIMSKKERQRKVIVEQILGGHMTRQDAVKRLGISSRHLRRIIARYLREGDSGLIHQSRGKRSGRALPEEVKQRAIALYQEKYFGFGPTLASEKLEEDDDVKIHRETLRLWLKTSGLWDRHRKRKVHRNRRPRRSRFGEMLQLDGSTHAWFDGVDEKQCLMNLVDDATGKTLALMDSGETLRAAFSLLEWWIREAGIPLSIYVDLKSLYVSPKSLREKYIDGEELVEPEWLTHFAKACKKLGIEIIKAYSPQAKGRVERKHAVYQDRFVKELKLKGITTIEGANTLLIGGYINKLNDKFAKPAQDPRDAHVALRQGDNLSEILCCEYERQVKNDWTVQLDNQHYQIEKNRRYCLQPKQKIIVRKHLDGSISLWHKEKRLAFHLIEARKASPETARSRKGYDTHQRSAHGRQGKHKSPWGQFNPSWLTSRKSKERELV